MSLYNMLFGVNQAADVLLACLGLKANDVPRFRDCYIENGQIVIYTRTGGGNRDFYGSLKECKENFPDHFNEDYPNIPTGPWNDDLRKNKFYVEDEDDNFDCTYAYFRFRFPEEFAEDLKALSDKVETHTPSEKWLDLFKRMEKEKC